MMKVFYMKEMGLFLEWNNLIIKFINLSNNSLNKNNKNSKLFKKNKDKTIIIINENKIT